MIEKKTWKWPSSWYPIINSISSMSLIIMDTYIWWFYHFHLVLLIGFHCDLYCINIQSREWNDLILPLCKVWWADTDKNISWLAKDISWLNQVNEEERVNVNASLRVDIDWLCIFYINPLSANPTKWSKTLKQFIGKLPTNCLSVYDHFVGLALKLIKVGVFLGR